VDWVALRYGKGRDLSVDSMRMACVIGGIVQFQAPTTLREGIRWYQLNKKPYGFRTESDVWRIKNSLSHTGSRTRVARSSKS